MHAFIHVPNYIIVLYRSQITMVRLRGFYDINQNYFLGVTDGGGRG